MQRINWIDWAKALAAITVVFCHLPQSQEWFYFRYLQACVITIFFFLSGYLKKDRGSEKENWRKYWHGLILPYIIYNVLFYPYWMIRFYLRNGAMPDLFAAMKPIIGALLFEHSNDFAEPLNGPLWYLPAILIMHVIIDQCRKTRYQHQILILLCIASFFLYAANTYWMFLPNLTPMGIFRRLPYYYLGYVMGQRELFRSIHTLKNLSLSIILFSLSVILFSWHLYEKVFILHIALFYPVNFCFLFSVLYGCKALNNIRINFIVNLSIGTLVIIGMHWILIGCINQVVERISGINDVPCYQWHEALPIAFLITSMLYPVILFGLRRAPALIGKTISCQNNPH